MASVITLTTDFGLSDGFVGAMKGVILSIAPTAVIVDICHDISPHDILSAALILEDACCFFPKDTIHLAIVDPGVGSERNAVAIRADRFTFVGPDNGLFDLVLGTERQRWEAVRLTNALYRHAPVSNTFHGRDIFAPAAAHLAAGIPFNTLGERVFELAHLNISQPVMIRNVLEAHVLRIDRFGNLITDLKHEQYLQWIPASAKIGIHVGGHIISELNRTFSDVPVHHPVAYFGSGGRLEIAVNQGYAAKDLEIGPGGKVILTHGT